MNWVTTTVFYNNPIKMTAMFSHFTLLKMKNHGTGEVFLFCIKNPIPKKCHTKICISKLSITLARLDIFLLTKISGRLISGVLKNTWDLFSPGNEDYISGILQALSKHHWHNMGKRRNTTL